IYIRSSELNIFVLSIELNLFMNHLTVNTLAYVLKAKLIIDPYAKHLKKLVRNQTLLIAHRRNLGKDNLSSEIKTKIKCLQAKDSSKNLYDKLVTHYLHGLTLEKLEIF